MGAPLEDWKARSTAGFRAQIGIDFARQRPPRRGVRSFGGEAALTLADFSHGLGRVITQTCCGAGRVGSRWDRDHNGAAQANGCSG